MTLILASVNVSSGATLAVVGVVLVSTNWGTCNFQVGLKKKEQSDGGHRERLQAALISLNGRNAQEQTQHSKKMCSEGEKKINGQLNAQLSGANVDTFRV